MNQDDMRPSLLRSSVSGCMNCLRNFTKGKGDEDERCERGSLYIPSGGGRCMNVSLSTEAYEYIASQHD